MRGRVGIARTTRIIKIRIDHALRTVAVQIFIRILEKFHFARGIAEIIRLPLVLGCCRRALGLHLHFAHRV